MTYRQKKLISIAILAMVVVFSAVEIKVAVGASKFYYNQNFLPPRIHQLCNDNFIWAEYKVGLEKRCRGLWNSWTSEILTNNI